MGNPYAYADCNPANFTDPSGLISTGCGLALADLYLSLVGDASLGVAVVAPLLGIPIYILTQIGGAVIDAYDLSQAFQQGFGVDTVVSIISATLDPLPLLGSVAAGFDVFWECLFKGGLDD